MTDLAIQFTSARSALRIYPKIFEKPENLLDNCLENFQFSYSRVILCGLVQLKFQDPATKTALRTSLDKGIIIDSSLHTLPAVEWASELIFTFADNIILHNSMADFMRMQDITKKMYEADHEILSRDYKEIQELISNNKEPEVIFTDPLWPDDSFLIDTGNIRTDPRSYPISANLFNTDFWRDWYQGFLDGKPLDWNLQREVALIPDADWDKGPAHIADKIEEIKARFLIEKAALSEKIDFNPETQKFYATPAPIVNPRLLSTNLTLISDALDEAMRGNGLRPDCWEDRTLRKTVEHFADDPERIEMDCMRVHRRLTAKLGNELPESDELVDLSATLLDVALDIRANHPDIAENRAKRGAQAVREASTDEKALLKEAIPYIRAITDENLGQQIEDDIGEILERVALTAPEDLAVTVDPVARTGSRLAKIWLKARKLDEAIKREITEAAETSKEILCIGGAIAMLYSVWPILLSFLGF